MTAILVTVYLLTGAAAALGCALTVRNAEGMRSTRPDVADSLDHLAWTANALPGGMRTGLLAVVVCWPLLALYVIREVAMPELGE